MALAKYYEDNIKISNNLKYLNGYRREEVVANKEIRIYYDCYYCTEYFKSVEDRNKHIKEVHNTIGPLLFIDGKIVAMDTEVYLNTIGSVKIDLCDLNGDDVKLVINKKEIKLPNNKDIDLTRYFENDKSEFKININNRKLKINKYDDEKISNGVINKVIQKWESQVSERKTLSPLPNECLKSHSLNEAEGNYLNGFYNYYIACSAENIQNKENRYQDAYQILSKFDNNNLKRKIILKIIAFRLNWIKILKEISLETNGTFNYITDFFDGKESEYNEKNHQTQKVYVEEDIQSQIDAIIAYQKKDDDRVKKFIREWTDLKIDSLKDLNKKDRILFLMGRFLENENPILTNEYYKKIISTTIEELIKNKNE